MKKLTLAIAVVALGVIGSATEVSASTAIATKNPPLLLAQSSWFPFYSAEGYFSVQFPAKPKKETSTETDDEGTSTDTMFSAKSGNGVFSVIYTEFNPEIPTTNSDRILDDAAGGIKGHVTKLLQERKVSVNGYPGRELEFQDSDGLTGRARLFLAHGRLYQLYAIKSRKQDANKFFESFKITKKRV